MALEEYIERVWSWNGFDCEPMENRYGFPRENEDRLAAHYESVPEVGFCIDASVQGGVRHLRTASYRMKKSNLLLAALGLAVFFFTASQLGWQNIWEQLRRIGWAILLVAAMRTGSQLLFTLAWAWTIPASARRVPFFDLFRIRLAGEAINYLIPSGTFGGEPLKASC